MVRSSCLTYISAYNKNIDTPIVTLTCLLYESWLQSSLL